MHNEFVNVWTHLCGALIVFLLLFYTILFIHYHKEIITDLDFRKLNSEIKNLTEPILPKVTNYTKNLFESEVIFTDLNQILDYFNSIKTSMKTAIHNSGEEVENEFHQIMDFIYRKENEWLNTFMNYNEKNLQKNSLPKWPLYCQLFGAIFCLSCSAIFHLFNSHSKAVSHMLNKLDYAGIVILIVGSCYPPNYYLFHCDFSKFLFYFLDYAYCYLTIMTITGLFVFYISIKDKYFQPQYHKFKGLLFLIFGISAGLPVIHLRVLGANGFEIEYNFTMWYIGGISYIVGALIYVLKFPERFSPGSFCIFGHSHQIFHIFVLVGVFTHYIACLETYNYRTDYSCKL